MHEGQARTRNTELLAGALGPNCIMNSDLGWIVGRVALLQGRNRPMFSKHVSVVPLSPKHTQEFHPAMGKQGSQWGVRTRKQ